MNYKDYPRYDIGESDIATLFMVGFDTNEKQNFGLKMQPLFFGGDSEYYAYFVDENCEIPEHYKLQFHCTDWLRIYDDNSLTLEIDAKKFNVYRAGDRGCIVQAINEESDEYDR